VPGGRTAGSGGELFSGRSQLHRSAEGTRLFRANSGPTEMRAGHGNIAGMAGQGFRRPGRRQCPPIPERYGSYGISKPELLEALGTRVPGMKFGLVLLRSCHRRAAAIGNGTEEHRGSLDVRRWVNYDSVDYASVLRDRRQWNRSRCTGHLPSPNPARCVSRTAVRAREHSCDEADLVCAADSLWLLVRLSPKCCVRKAFACARFELVRRSSHRGAFKVFCYATSLLVEGAKRGR